MKSPQRYLTLASFIVIGSAQSLLGATVTNTSDSGPGSLRNAIATAINGETINFNPALNGATITLTSGHFLIDNLAVTIDASSLPAGLTLSGNNLSRIFAVSGSSDISLQNLKIRNGNAIENSGGGIFMAGVNLTMTDCTISDCSATFNGGGMNLAIGATTTFERCTITGNSTGNLGLGGGVFIGGASTTLFRSCVISGNSSPFGGGFSINNSSPSFTNCTVQGNSGGGFRNASSSDPVLQNCIVWGNTTTGTTAAQQLANSTGSNPAISYSLIQGASDSTSFADGDAVSWGAGNFNGTLLANDPKFASALAAGSAPHSGGNLRLLTGSPVLDLGNNLAGIGSLDLARSARTQNSTVDLGAYEGFVVTFALLHPSLTPSADSNHNGVTNFQEYAMGFDPTAAGNSSNPAMSSSAGFKFITINQRPNAVDFKPLLMTTTTLAAWTEMIEGTHYSVESTTPVSSSRTTSVLRLLGTDAKRFYRQGYVTVN